MASDDQQVERRLSTDFCGKVSIDTMEDIFSTLQRVSGGHADAIFADISAFDGRVVVHAAMMGMFRAVIGMHESINEASIGVKRAFDDEEARELLTAPIGLFKKRLCDVKSLDPCSYVYCVANDEQIIREVASLFITSSTLKVLILIVRPSDMLTLAKVGFVDLSVFETSRGPFSPQLNKNVTILSGTDETDTPCNVVVVEHTGERVLRIQLALYGQTIPASFGEINNHNQVDISL